MKTIVRRDSDEDWKNYVRRLIHKEGVIDASEEPTDESLHRFDKKLKVKKFSNHDWKSKTDDDARIVNTKDGLTHFGYKAEHTVDLETDVVLSATVQEGESLDSQTPVSLDEQAERSKSRPCWAIVVAHSKRRANSRNGTAVSAWNGVSLTCARPSMLAKSGFAN